MIAKIDRFRARLHLPFAIACLATALLPTTVRADESLAKSVPADVGFFVEIRDAADLLATLTEPEIWSSLADFAGQPSRPEDAEQWRKQIQQTVKMEPAEAIRSLFSQRVAFIGDAAGRAQDAVVLCRPPPSTPIKELIARFKAERLKDISKPATYQLHGNIGVAEFDGLLLFGDLLQPNGMFRRMLQVAADGRLPRLADDPQFKALLARIPDKPDGVLFARFPTPAKKPATTAPVSQPAGSRPAGSAPSQPTMQRSLESALPDLPGPLRGASTVMVGVQRERDGRLLHLTAVGDRAANAEHASAAAKRLTTTLPERTLAAWEGRVDYPAIVDAMGGLPPRSVLRMALEFSEASKIVTRLAAALDQQTCVAIGLVRPEENIGDPAVPALAWLVATHENSDAEAQWNALISGSVAAYNILSLNNKNLQPLPLVEEVQSEGGTSWMVDLSALLSAKLKAAIGRVQLCWTVHEGVLIVATHADWLRQIVAARAGRGKTLADAIKLSRRDIPAASDSVVVLQTGPISDVSEIWLEYLRTNLPQVMEESWWRKNQPGGGTRRLGIDVNNDAKRMTVKLVTPGEPADGWLAVGDVLLGANQKRFATSQPWDEMKNAFTARPHGGYFDVIYERGGGQRVMRIPIPFFDGVQALRRAVAMGKIAQRVVYFDDVADSAGSRGFLTIELRGNAPPLFPIASQPSASQPTSAATRP